ncbi:molybdopterin-dependent oxidoreductase [Adlercreutzia sp. R25]|uniref:molybdopterin-dependent oxidoreductase n=1 Tax=Adlercreutzia shanghongiae TaxID=3111773 RepID=UPI002DBFFEDB|nr:molybdopterin-dependent oxidoreductase [Adlercreutzia sp. R25]MEC4273687.1 molybdopterin-dependent oxidoreductase [Adlercreutzia sp. R25]
MALGCWALIGTLAVATGCSGAGALAPEDEVAPDAILTTPAVFVDDDGDLIQLAPDDDASDSVYFQQDPYVQYNTNYLHADERGCKSCHADLKAMLMESAYNHPGRDGVDTEWTVKTCRGCHSSSNNEDYFTESGLFGDLMHATHMDVETECWNCHATSSTSMTGHFTDDDGKMLLWEDARANALRGFIDIAADAVDESAFSFDQEEVVDPETLFNLTPQFYENDYMRAEKTRNNEPLDEKMLEEWTVTVSGEVSQEKTFNLKELIDDPSVPKVTQKMKWHCVLNPFGGNGIGQVEATGIPVSYLVEQCGGLTGDAASILPIGADGFQDVGGVDISHYESNVSIIAYEMNGEPLTWNNGYPATFMMTGVGTGCFVKEVGDIVFQGPDGPLWDPAGWDKSVDDHSNFNNPNIGIIGLKDGQVVRTGETVSIGGYADAFDRVITSIELSFDRGTTWKTLPTPGTDNARWVKWSYDFTPEEDGTYYVMARATSDEGVTSDLTVDCMLTATADPDSIALGNGAAPVDEI